MCVNKCTHYKRCLWSCFLRRGNYRLEFVYTNMHLLPPPPIIPTKLLLPVHMIKQLDVLDITIVCLHDLVFFASTTSTFGNYFCYNMHAYNVIRKHWQNDNCDNLSWIDSNSDCTESIQFKYSSHFCMLRIVNSAEILIFLIFILLEYSKLNAISGSMLMYIFRLVRTMSRLLKDLSN